MADVDLQVTTGPYILCRWKISYQKVFVSESALESKVFSSTVTSFQSPFACWEFSQTVSFCEYVLVMTEGSTLQWHHY